MKTICDTETDPLAEYLGSNVIVRSVTHYYTGKLMGYDDKWLVLHDAAWVPDTGRWAEALATGKVTEVEPYPRECLVGVGGVIDISPWTHDLPQTVK
jgi:hypothetical protein